MDTPTIYQEVVKAVPVIIGGLLALLGGVIGQVITHRLATSREKRLLLRERIEALVRALHGHSQWLHEKHTSIFEDKDHDTPSPLNEAQMLQELYFPELSSEVLAIMQAQIPMLEFIGNQRIARMKNREAWIKVWDRKPYNEMYNKYLAALNAATKKCREILQLHLGS